MATDRPFTHPNVGHQVKVEQRGRKVSLTFVCGTPMKADELAESIVAQLKNGALNLTLMGKPTSVVEEA